MAKQFIKAVIMLVKCFTKITAATTDGATTLDTIVIAITNDITNHVIEVALLTTKIEDTVTHQNIIETGVIDITNSKVI
ncbi:MAG: hypothetical protein AAGB35_05075 [Pseudomonadota bacterium]